MATITGTKLDATCLYKDDFADGAGTETWLLTASFGAYTASTDDATLTGVGAYITTKARDGKTRTLLGSLPAIFGDNGSGTNVCFTGATVAAGTVSTDALTGELNTYAMTETDAAAGTKVGITVSVRAA